MEQTFENKLLIFSDGASLGNPGPGGYGAVLVFPLLDEVVELGGNKPKTTNNEMELTAIVAAFSQSITSTSHVHVYTDSAYVINGITKWVHGWEKNNWMTSQKEPVSHKELWQTLVSLVRERERASSVSWHHVPGHSGVVGNERADVIATSFASAGNPTLFRGRLSQYNSAILDTNYDTESYEKRQATKDRAKQKAFSYLSMVDGVVVKHATWAECEQRVKGQKAKFRKSLSAEDEAEIIASWTKGAKK
jgi:ribonuclease HI